MLRLVAQCGGRFQVRGLGGSAREKGVGRSPPNLGGDFTKGSMISLCSFTKGSLLPESECDVSGFFLEYYGIAIAQLMAVKCHEMNDDS